MPSFDLISVVITTYNRSDALALVLDGLKHQTDKGFEVIIADDGSTQSHQNQIAQSCEASGLSASHVWHPDVGFTASQVRNLGVAASKGAYLVLMDGDCVPEVDFIARHRALMQAGCFVNGSRVLLSEAFTRQLLAHTDSIGSRSAGYWLRRRFSGDASKLTGLLRLPDFRYRLQPKFVWKGIRSCNMAVWKSDYLRVNGFDESFVGWGHEDADFVLRLHNAGLLRKNGFCATEVYHLWHPEASRTQESVNADKVRQREATGQVRSTIGYQESKDAADVVVRSWG
jgi:glycosyltransferase involved in cell wall biosynthesis